MNVPTLHERYHELHGLRAEGLRRYGRLPFPQTGGPPARISFPSFGRKVGPYASVGIGPFVIGDFPPIARVALECFAAIDRPVDVLEIGPGRGVLAGLLRERYPEKIAAYYGVELDPHVEGPYVRVAGVRDAGPIDVAIASEVIEHVPAEVCYAEFLAPLAAIVRPGGTAIFSIPNPLVPGGIVRDFTHVQNYAWYDLYAILRLAFARVDVTRTHYVFGPGRMFGLPGRVAIAKMQELDWCEGLIAVARDPIAPTPAT